MRGIRAKATGLRVIILEGAFDPNRSNDPFRMLVSALQSETPRSLEHLGLVVWCEPFEPYGTYLAEHVRNLCKYSVWPELDSALGPSDAAADIRATTPPVQIKVDILLRFPDPGTWANGRDVLHTLDFDVKNQMPRLLRANAITIDVVRPPDFDVDWDGIAALRKRWFEI
jgi:hypothetical protein